MHAKLGSETGDNRVNIPHTAGSGNRIDSEFLVVTSQLGVRQAAAVVHAQNRRVTALRNCKSAARHCSPIFGPGLQSVSMKRLLHAFLPVLLYLSTIGAGCHARIHPAATVISVGSLHVDLEKIFSGKEFAGALWGVDIIFLDRPEELYEKNSKQLCIPASNNKILTAASALLRLGADYRFQTRVLTDGRIRDGILDGNLIISGTGDPSNSPRFQAGDPFDTFREWAGKLRERGVRRIAGDIIADTAGFEEILYSESWEWGDLTQNYAAPVSILQFNENIVSLQIAPDPAKAGFATIATLPLEHYPPVENRLITGPEGHPDIQIERGESDDIVVVRGFVPSRGSAILREFPVRNPVLYYLSALKQVLCAEGIDASDSTLRLRQEPDRKPLSVLWIHTSPALSEMLKPLMKSSQNLFAEDLVRALGGEFRGLRTFSHGKEVVEETLARLGIEKGSYSYADGSGLSRHNLCSAETLLKILKAMYGAGNFRIFYDSLPIAGVDGTLANRMKGTQAENNVRAKTGTMANVSAISGYLRTRDGEALAFSMLINNYLCPKEQVEAAQDKALELLANFSRK
jgi:serine-type D-Ala-D-Ala carboxypeptidase/endopeptidase (penicillin-binding protein 4)